MKISEIRSDILTKMKKDDLSLLFSDSVNLIDKMVKVNDKIHKMLEEGYLVEDSLDLLDELDSMMVVNDNLIITASSIALADYESTLTRLFSFSTSYLDYKDMVREHLDIWLPFDKNEVINLVNLIEDCIGQLSCYIYYFFDLLPITFNENDLSEISILPAVDDYIVKNKLTEDDLIELVSKLRGYTFKYVKTGGIFLTHPELLEPIEKLVGSVIFSPVDIKMVDVQKLLSGEISPEDFMSLVEEKEEELIESEHQ